MFEIPTTTYLPFNNTLFSTKLIQIQAIEFVKLGESVLKYVPGLKIPARERDVFLAASSCT